MEPNRLFVHLANMNSETPFSFKNRYLSFKSVSWRSIILNVFGVFIATIFFGLAAFVAFPESWVNKILGGKGSSLTGRELAVDGDIDIDWHWTTPGFHIEKLRMSNVAGAKDPQMVEIEALDFKIKLWKLLMLRLELPELTITKPKVILEKDADGNKNWELPLTSSGNTAANAALPSHRGNFPIIGMMQVKDGTLIYRDAQKDLDLEMTIETISGSPNDENDVFELSGDGTLQKQKFTIDATGGALTTLRDSSKDYPLDLKIGMGETKIAVKGTFRDPVKLEGINTTLDLRGANMADLFYLTGIPLPPTPAYSIEGKLEKEGDLWTFTDFKGKVGDSDLGGNISYDISGERGFVKGEAVSQLLDIKDMGGFIGLAPGSEEAKNQKNKDRVLPDINLDLSRLRAADMDISLKVSRIEAPSLPLKSMNIRFDLREGVLKLDPMELGLVDGSIGGTMVLNGTKDTPDVNMDLKLKRIGLKQFFSDTRFESFSAGHFGGRINLAGQGKSLADVLATSNGQVTVSMSGGQISLTIVEAAGIDIGELTPLLLGEDKNTTIRCAVGDFGVKDGLLSSNIFVFDTTDTNIQGDAKINLKNEALDIRAEANPKDGSLLALRTPLTIGGTMKKPAIGIDPGELAAKGGVAAALGAIFPPLAIIPFIELGLGEDSDCRDLIQQAKANSAKPVNQ